MTTKYIANDGTEFEKMNECIEYENRKVIKGLGTELNYADVSLLNGYNEAVVTCYHLETAEEANTVICYYTDIYGDNMYGDINIDVCKNYILVEQNDCCLDIYTYDEFMWKIGKLMNAVVSAFVS